jgi:hypothetical protein
MTCAFHSWCTLRAVCDITPHQEPVMAMDLSPGGEHVVSASGGDMLARSHLRDFSNHLAVSLLPGISAPNVRQPSATSSWVGSDVPAEPSSDDSITCNFSFSLIEKDSTQLPSKGDLTQERIKLVPLSAISIYACIHCS